MVVLKQDLNLRRAPLAIYHDPPPSQILAPAPELDIDGVESGITVRGNQQLIEHGTCDDLSALHSRADFWIAVFRACFRPIQQKITVLFARGSWS